MKPFVWFRRRDTDRLPFDNESMAIGESGLQPSQAVSSVSSV